MQNVSMFKLALSYLWPQPVETFRSPVSGKLEVMLDKGRYILNSGRANYSFGGLHEVFQEVFKRAKVADRNIQKALILGFGAGSIHNILTSELNMDVEVTGVEADETVLRIYRNYFASTPEPLLIQAKAEEFVQSQKNKYDLIACDIFVELDVPPAVETVVFFRSLQESLCTGGILFFNKVVNSPERKKSFDQLLENARTVFPSIDVWQIHGGNRVLVALK
jgi:spermidine synthase